MAASAYAGGRAEAHIFGPLEGDLLVERDVSSLYPSSAIFQPLRFMLGRDYRVLKR